MRAVALLLASTLLVLGTVALAPTAAAGPARPECGDVLGEAKCEEIAQEIRDLLQCTCPPL